MNDGVLVTGGTGFLGRHVVERLAALGRPVVFTGRDAAVGAVIARATGASFAALDHGAPGADAALRALAEGAAAVVHCAALSAPWGAPAAFERCNVTATAEALAAARAGGARRFVHISTPSLYFDFRDRVAVREDEPLPTPSSEYAASKRRAEALVRDSGLEAAILRPRALFGPHDRTLMPRLARVLARGAFPLMRGGRALIDLTCVENAVDAIVLALERPLRARVATWNVSNGEPIAVRDLLPRVGETLGLPVRTRRVPYRLVDLVARGMEWAAPHHREPPLTRYGVGVMAYSLTLSLDRIHAELGWRPRIPVAEGLARLAAWRRDGGAP